MTKIVCISDTHGTDRYSFTVPEGDILIHSGDFSSYGHQDDTIYFLKWFNELPHKNKVLVCGNHDKLAFERPGLFAGLLGKHCPKAHYLEDKAVTIDGLNFWGAPWTPTFYNWYFMADRGSAIKAHWDKIPANTDVLVTHGPPFGFLDKTNNWNHATGKKYDDCLGCRDLQEAIYRIEPKLCVFGHIHGSGGQQVEYFGDTGNKTILVNASLMNEDYEIKNSPVVVEL